RFAALNVLTGAVHGRHTERRRRVEFLAFMNEVVAEYPRPRNPRRPRQPQHAQPPARPLARAPSQRPPAFTPTHASWLNQVECWFSILSSQALRHSSFRSPRAVRDPIDDFITTYNTHARPFLWKAAEVHPSAPKRSIANLSK